MKLYLTKDLNDPSKMKLEKRSTPPADALIAPEGEDAEWLKVVDLVDEDGQPYKAAQVDEAKKIQVLSDRAAKAQGEDYKIKRRREYPPIGDQLDALYKKFHLSDDTQWSEIVAKIEAVKTKYPKPE